jgi:predicted nucleic acid-binding protein
MITAIDTNILIDILAGTPQQFATATEAVRKLRQQGQILVPVICYAELASRFTNEAKLKDFIDLLDATVLPLAPEAAYLAGTFFRSYLQRGGSRQRIIADFLIAAQAQISAGRILTKDKRFFGANFPKLKAIAPADLITPRSSP